MPTNQAHRVGDIHKSRAGLPAQMAPLRLGSCSFGNFFPVTSKKPTPSLTNGIRFAAVDNAAGSFCIPSISEWVVADIVLINPRFELSFWGLEHCMRLFRETRQLAGRVPCLTCRFGSRPPPCDFAGRERRRY